MLLGADHALLHKRRLAIRFPRHTPNKGYYIVGDLYNLEATFVMRSVQAGPLETSERAAMCLHFIDATKICSDWGGINSRLQEMYEVRWDVWAYIKDFFPNYDLSKNLPGVIKNAHVIFYDDTGTVWEVEQELET